MCPELPWSNVVALGLVFGSLAVMVVAAAWGLTR